MDISMQKGYSTKVSRAMEKYLEQQRNTSFSVADVYDYMQGEGRQVNLATVYRNLDKLTEKKMLVKYKTQGEDGYSYRVEDENRNCHEHLHLHCMKCGKIFHFDTELMDEMSVCLKEQFGFLLDCEKSSLCGICAQCKEKLNNMGTQCMKECTESLPDG